MNSSRVHLEKLHTLVGEFENKSGDVVIGKMVPEFAELVVSLSDELDAAQMTMLRLNKAVIALTIVTVVVGFAQLYVAIFPVSQKAPSTKDIPNSNAPEKISNPIKDGNEKVGDKPNPSFKRDAAQKRVAP